MSHLSEKKCIPCEGGVCALNINEVQPYLDQISDWTYDQSKQHICKTYKFKGFGKTMAFVNAVAWIATQEMHHPTLIVTYNSCTVEYTTHASNGLTENDFICAAKIDALL